MGPYGPAPGQGPQQVQGGVSGCVDLMTCYGKCPGLTQDCTGRCDATGTPAAQGANTDVFRCIAQYQCQDENCITTNCTAQLQTCANTPGTNVAMAPPSPPSEQQPSQPAQPQGTSLPPVSDAEFVFTGNGLDYVPELIVAQQGVPVLLDGLWADTKHSFSLELRGNTYTITFAGSSAYFQSGARITETGTWSLAGTNMTVTPSSAHLSATSKLHQEGEDSKTDPPRAWTLIGARLQFQKFGDASHATYQVDGLVISGTAPSWDSVGAFSHTMRRAR